jgi:hypothetical protein
MRVNLNCPYSDKDEAKSLGARWDMAKKTWYVIDPEDLQPFARWIKGLGVPTEWQAKKAAQKAVKRAEKVLVTVGAMYVEEPHPDGLLPWEEEDPPELIRLVRDIGYQT